jgi:predicted DNA-binding protein
MFDMTKQERGDSQRKDVRIGVRIPTELHKQLMMLAIRRRLPLSAVVRELLEKSLRRS